MTVHVQAGNVSYNHTEHTAAQKTLYLMNTINHNQKINTFSQYETR